MTTFNRRNFLQWTLGLAACGLYGCGDSESLAVAPQSNFAPVIALPVTGRVDPDRQVEDPVVSSAFGPTVVNGSDFTTSISAGNVGLLALEDRAGGVRGFSLTLPDEAPVISATSTALAIIFMEPGFMRVDPTEARREINRFQASGAFPPLVDYLRQNAGTRLDLLSGETQYRNLLQELLRSLGTPFTDLARPTASLVGGQVQITNRSPRFIQVARGGNALPELLAPYGVLLDDPLRAQGELDYTLQSLGSTAEGQASLQAVNAVFLETAFFATVLPLLELAVGSTISTQDGLALLDSLNLSVPPLGAEAFEPQALAQALESTTNTTLGGEAAEITSQFSSLAQEVVSGSYLAGLAWSLGAIFKFKQHKDNPTQAPIGTPIALGFVAAALLFLPSILGITGSTLFGRTQASET